VLALGQRGRLDQATLHAAIEDEDTSVRAMATRYLGMEPDPERTERLVQALDDPELIVRIAAVSVLATWERDERTCNLLLERASADESTGVRLVALDALGEPCPGSLGSEVVAHLHAVTEALPPEGDGEWRPASRALSALARLRPEQARSALPAHGEHPSPFVRAAAAEVAGMLGDRPTLDVLVGDSDPNVRTAALPAIALLDARAAHSLALDQLGMNDGQLLITAAGLIERVPDADAAEAVLTAFERISSARRETARDPRMALLAVLRDTGGASMAPRLEPYLADYDAVVATEVESVLEAWTGESREARPEAPSRLALPTVEQLADMDGSVVVLHMARGGEVVVELLPMLAPTNAFRFFRQAGDGHFDGLTLHRWVPNFVIQGGSPAANEYAGDGPYTRDEIGTVSHWRGTVGLSTRGRDTGDGQVFVNLVHNVRLDYDYTVFGTVIAGMDVVDALLTGDVIQRTEIRAKD
jgi:cyclophilin family peptidyl-prolyl cis-trans isomerase/HEAT repeat protein